MWLVMASVALLKVDNAAKVSTFVDVVDTVEQCSELMRKEFADDSRKKVDYYCIPLNDEVDNVRK